MSVSWFHVLMNRKKVNNVLKAQEELVSRLEYKAAKQDDLQVASNKLISHLANGIAQLGISMHALAGLNCDDFNDAKYELLKTVAVMNVVLEGLLHVPGNVISPETIESINRLKALVDA